jgi:hypothetical protein
VDSLFGLTVQPTRGEFVLVERKPTSSSTAGRAGLSVHRGFGASAADAATQITATLARAPRHSPRVRHRRVLGLTCSDGGAAHAPLLRDRLADHNFDVVAVQFAAASKALARHLAHKRAAVCVIESDAVIVLMAGRDGSVASAHNRPRDSDELSRWLAAVFQRHNWQPDSVVVVGQGRVDAITSRLRQALEVRVWTPPRAQAALALGAALCAAQRRPVTDTPELAQTQHRRSRRTAGVIGMTAGLSVAAAALATAAIMRPVHSKTVQPEHLGPPAATAAPTSPAPAAPPATLPESPPSMAALTAPTETPPAAAPPAVQSTPSQQATQPDSSSRSVRPPSPASPPGNPPLPSSPQAPPAPQDAPPADCVFLCGISI